MIESSDPPQGRADRVNEYICRLIWNDSESRFRTLVRLVFVSAPLYVILIGSMLAKGMLADVLPLEGLADTVAGQITSMTGTQLYGTLTLVVALVVSSWLIDRRRLTIPPLRHMKRWGGDLVFGLVLGLLAQIGILLVGLAVGSITVTDTFTGAAGRMPIFWEANLLVFYSCVGLREEVIFRWYLLPNLAEGLAWFDGVDRRSAVWGAIGLSAVAFSLWHIGSSVQFLVLAGCFGLFFGFSYAVTGSIAIPVGFHTAWDLGELGLFAPRGLSANTMVEVAVGDPVTIFGGFSLMDGVPFLAILVATIAVVGWVRLRDGAGTFRDELSIPVLHEHLNHRLVMVHFFPALFDRDSE